MNETEILARLKVLFESVLGRAPIKLEMATTAASVEGWDSLVHVMIIDRVEKHFQVKFKLREIMKFASIGDMVGCIMARHA